MDRKILSLLLKNTGDMALKRRAKEIIEEINPSEGERILEVGCGDGYYLHLLSSMGVKRLSLTGVDIDENSLKSAKRNLKGRRIKLLKADILGKLPFAANTFDKIIMSEVCEHLSDDVKGLTEVKRVLRKGGVLVVTVPNHNYPLLWDPVNWILEHFFNTHVGSGFWAGLWNQHLRLYKPHEIKKSVSKAGYKITDVKSLTFWCLPFNHNIVHLTARMLYSGNLNQEMTEAISKFETQTKKPPLINFAFDFVNLVDKLNDVFPIRNSGVGVLVSAVKPR